MKKACFKAFAFLLCPAFALAFLNACGTVVFSPSVKTPLILNEVVTSNTRSLTHERLGTPDWVELYNASEQAVSLKGFGLSDNLREPHKWVFPDVSIPAGGFITVYCDSSPSGEEEPLCTGFGLSKSGETLFLTDAYYNMLIEFTVPALKSDISYARRDDGSYGYCASPTPGEANAAPIADTMDELVYAAGPNDLRLNEVLPRNGSFLAGDGNLYPFAELYNASDAPVLLSSYYLTDDETDPQKWQIAGETLAPGGYALIHFTGKKASLGEGSLPAPFRLSSSDTYLILYDGSLRECGRLTWDTEIYDDVSVLEDGGYCAFPTPAYENVAERFTTLVLSDMDESDPIRLNEVLLRSRYSLADENGDRGAWAELINNSDAAVSLKGYYMSDDAEEPFKWALPDRTLEAGEYLIVFLSGKNRLEPQLHSSFRLSKNDGVCMLANKDGLRVDRAAIDPAMGDDVSIGRDESGAWRYFSYPTPGAKNSTHSSQTLASLGRVQPNGVYISEVSAVSAPKSGKADWIELYNGSSRDKKLAGWHLTNDIDTPSLFSLENVVVPAGGYALIHASAHSTDATGVTAPFSISASGETLFLFDQNGLLSDVFETGALKNGVTSGRLKADASGERHFFTAATKGASNSAASYPAYAMEPIFSERALYHKEVFELVLSTSTEGAHICYTLDGSLPTADSALYTGPLTIKANATVRAVAVKEGLLSSNVMTATYLFEKPHTLPVVCLTMDKSDFDTVYSVTDRWQKIEREGHFAYFETDGTLAASVPCGLRASGASTLTMRQKSLALYMRGGYGASAVNYPFFGEGVKSFSSLVLRNSGQDASSARIRDSFCMRAVSGLKVDAVRTRPVAVYINGSYWGLYDLNENQNEDYLNAYYGVDPNKADIIRRNETPLSGTRNDFKRVRAYALSQDLSQADKYEAFCEWVDVEYFTDYLIAQTFFANSDMFNQKYWRAQDYSVKWRPIYFDLDFSLHSPTRNILSAYFTEAGVPSRDGTLTNMDIYVGLRKNAAWREQFCKRYVWVVENYLNMERLTSILDELSNEMRPEMERQTARWGLPSSVSRWESELKTMRDTLKKRPENTLKFLQKEFGLSDETMQEYVRLAREG